MDSFLHGGNQKQHTDEKSEDEAESENNNYEENEDNNEEKSDGEPEINHNVFNNESRKVVCLELILNQCHSCEGRNPIH